MRGLTRTIDSEGRFTIPSDFRLHTGIGPKAVVETYIDGQNIIIKLHDSSCSLCGDLVHMSNFGAIINEKKVCMKCLIQMKQE